MEPAARILSRWPAMARLLRSLPITITTAKSKAANHTHGCVAKMSKEKASQTALFQQSDFKPELIGDGGVDGLT
jgi:hypothetical protein